MSLPAPQRPRLIRVRRIQDVTPHLRRITFHSNELTDYPFTCGGAHIKLMFPQPGQRDPVLPTLTEQGPRWASPAEKPLLRTFTLRAFRREQNELDVEFALHGESGPASRFALNARIGDTLGLSQPGGPSPMLQAARHYYLAGDLTALPAIAAMLEEMATDATGRIALLVPSPADIQPLPVPAGVHIDWIVGGPEAAPQLVEALLGAPLEASMSQFWFGGEERIVVPLRRHARRTLAAPRSCIYAVPYWRQGQSEEAYHPARHAVMDTET